MSLQEKFDAVPETAKPAKINTTRLNPIIVTVAELLEAARKCNTDTAKHLIGNLTANYPTPELQAAQSVTTDRATVEALLKNCEVKSVVKDGCIEPQCCKPQSTTPSYSSMEVDEPIE